MGTNTPTTRANSTKITDSWFDDYLTALSADIVPRNSSCVPTDIGADIGSTILRWSDAYLRKLFIGAIASGLSIEEEGSSVIAKVNSVKKLDLHPTNGMDGQYIKTGSIPRSSMGALNEAVSTATGGTSGTSPYAPY